jgi:uncharacterized protein YndB with AHSA1/START domain
MSRNSIAISAAPETVFDVLDDAYAYPGWVVGTRRIRRVDATWPAVGSKFHHAIGNAVAELHDSSTILERRRPDHIALEVRFRPTGVARVDIDIVAEGPGSLVSIKETPTRGAVSHLPHFITGPLLELRNALALQRLRHEVEMLRERANG